MSNLIRRVVAAATRQTTTHRAAWSLRGRTFALAGSASVSALVASRLIHSDSTPTSFASDTSHPFVSSRLDTSPSHRPLSEHVRAYIVYTLCSIPGLVDASPRILASLMSIPGIQKITEGVVRATFYNQFVGGETAEDVLPILGRLRQQRMGALFAYSVEVDENKASGKITKASEGNPIHRKIVDEIIHCIDVAAEFEEAQSTSARRTWVVVKPTALLPDADSLQRLSAHILRTRTENLHVKFPGCPTPRDLAVLKPGLPVSEVKEDGVTSLSVSDIEDLKELHSDLERICTRAAERGVKVFVDAEYSWYQPAIDALTLALMRKFNKIDGSASSDQPLVYVTFQAYLRRTPDYLVQSLEDAKIHGYSLGAKLVRGAYHSNEIAFHGKEGSSLSSENLPPVWLTKPETDECYNACLRLLVDAVKKDADASRESGPPPKIGVLFGTHNWESCNMVLNELVRFGLASKENGKVRLGAPGSERVAIAQLYGMGDALSEYLVNSTASSSPFVVRYIPYGALAEVMPYLGRRAIENKSMLGPGAAAERQRAGAEICRRLFG